MGKKMLIADDEPNIVVSLEFLMKQKGYDVRVGERRRGRARARSPSSRPDLVLLDVMMPRMSGYEVCQTVRENPDWQGIKIIMLSAKGRDDRGEQGHGRRRRRLRDQAVLDEGPGREGPRAAGRIGDVGPDPDRRSRSLAAWGLVAGRDRRDRAAGGRGPRRRGARAARADPAGPRAAAWSLISLLLLVAARRSSCSALFRRYVDGAAAARRGRRASC